MITLYRFNRAAVALADCLADSFADLALEGFLQTPRRLRLVRRDDAPLAPEALGQVYEAHLFCERGELRWLLDPESTGLGQAAWISEEPQSPAGFEPVVPRLDDLETIDGRVLSYGEDFPGAEVPRGVGAYAVREYIGPAPGTAGEDGNMIIVEQRILRIVPRPETGVEQ